MLEARDLFRFYHAGDEETLALRGVSLEVEPAEVVAVTGPSGSGKSTLLACLAGLDEPDGGVVRIDGQRLSRRSEEERTAIRAHRVGVLFQSANLLDNLTVADNVSLARRLARRARTEPTVSELLAALGIEDRARARPPQLSGGELVRAGMAVAIANSPSVILADEPTGELDRENAVRVARLLREQARAGAAVLVVTHDDMVASAADRVMSLCDGRVLE
jgi:putative ABC transport system ATP-binding protein